MVGHEAASENGEEGVWFPADAGGYVSQAVGAASPGNRCQGDASRREIAEFQEAFSATTAAGVALDVVSAKGWPVSRPFFR
jgi:hypothetical protein